LDSFDQKEAIMCAASKKALLLLVTVPLRLALLVALIMWARRA
jgi:hypothetical protein